MSSEHLLGPPAVARRWGICGVTGARTTCDWFTVGASNHSMLSRAAGYRLRKVALRQNPRALRRFAVDKDFSPPTLRDREGKRLQCCVSPPVRMVETYFDSPDLRLRAAGVVVCRRAGAEGHWLLRAPGPDGVRKVRLPPDGADPPGEIRRLVTGRLGEAPLRPRLTLDADLEVVQLAARVGTPLVRLVDEAVVSERRDDGQVRRWRNLVLEPLDAGGRLVDAVAGQLVAAGARPVGATTVPDLALDQPGRGPRPSGLLAIRVGQLVEEIADRDLQLRLGEPEGVHDLRVAVRRLRSLLATFGRLLGPEPTLPLRAELGWLGDLLGAAREAEVIEVRIGNALRTVAAAERLGDACADLIGNARSACVTTRERLDEGLASARYRAAVELLRRFAEDLAVADDLGPGGGSGSGKGRRSERGGAGTNRSGEVEAVGEAVSRELRRARRRVRDARSADATRRDEALHAARKQARRVRYAVEVLRPCRNRRDRRLEEAFATVQEVLGARNDAVVARRFLVAEGARARSLPEGNGFTYGILAEREAQAVLAADDAFGPAWQAAARAVRGWSAHRR